MNWLRYKCTEADFGQLKKTNKLFLELEEVSLFLNYDMLRRQDCLINPSHLQEIYLKNNYKEHPLKGNVWGSRDEGGHDILLVFTSSHVIVWLIQPLSEAYMVNVELHANESTCGAMLGRNHSPLRTARPPAPNFRLRAALMKTEILPAPHPLRPRAHRG